MILKTDLFPHLPSKSYLPVWPKKWCQPQKLKWEVNMRRNPVVLQLMQKGIRIVFCDYLRYTTICYLNQQNYRKNLNNLQKQEIYKIEIFECALTHNLLLLWMFIWIPQNKINLVTLFSIPIIFEILSWSTLNIKAPWNIALEYCMHALKQ